MNRSASKLAAGVVVAFFATLPLFAQNYLKPRPVGSAPDSCTTCTAINLGKPSYPYSLPFKSFKGRFLDSTGTREYQQPVRTFRARKAVYNPGNNRIYSIYGSMFVAYKLDNFFNTLGGPLTGPPAARAEGGEQYLGYDSMFYAETGGWQCSVVDGQDRLFDFDFNDRNEYLLAYSIFGWGIGSDTGLTFSKPRQVTGTGTPSKITALWGSGKYYAVTGAGNLMQVFDITTQSGTPALIRSEPWKVFGSERTADGKWYAMTDGRSTLRLFSLQELVTGGSGTVYTMSNVIMGSITSDGTNFYVIESSTTSDSWIMWKINPSTGVVTKFPFSDSLGMVGEEMTWGDGYIGVAGSTRGGNPRVQMYDMTTGSPQLMPEIEQWLQSFYYHAPDGYAQPPAYSLPFALTPLKYQGKLYLIYSGFGLGDVFEIQTGDTLDISLVAAPWGSPNNNSPNKTLGPYFGDLVTFNSTFTGTSSPTVNWNFANPESTDNTTSSAVGSAVTHRYSGITSGTAITAAKTVTGVASTDANFNDTQIVTLLLPSARVLNTYDGSTYVAGGTVSVPVVLSDTWADASDGTIEGHYDEWTLDSGTPTLMAPDGAFAVGGCGSHTLSMTARYKPYTGSGSSVTPSAVSPYSSSVTNLLYSAQAFATKALISSSTATTVSFTNATRVSTVGFASGATWTETWELLDAAGGVIRTQPTVPVAVPVGQKTSFVVNKSEIISGGKVRLTLSLSAGAIVSYTGCDTQGTFEIPLIAPDPAIDRSACSSPTTAGGCTLTAVSNALRDQSAWSYAWKLNGSTVPGATQKSWAPTFASAGTYTVTVLATNPIGSTESAGVSLNVTIPPCNGAPQNVNFTYYTVSGNIIHFDAAPAYNYTYQTCDNFSWNFGDGQTGTGSSVEHNFSASNTYSVRMTVSNTSGNASVTKSVQVGTVTPPPPPPTCSAVKSGNVFAGYTGPTTGCTPLITSPPCGQNESVSFRVDTYGYTMQDCDAVSWDFGDGSSKSSSRTPSHAYSAAGTYTITLKVSNSATPSGVTNLSQIKVQQVTNSCTAPANDLSVSYYGQSSGCTPSGGTCTPGERISITWTSASGYYLQSSCDSMLWEFGDGQTDSTVGLSKVHTYSGTGPFNIKVTISNSKGSASAQRTLSFIAIPKPTVSISPQTVNAPAGSTINFAGTAVSDSLVTGYGWRVLKVVNGSTTVLRTVTNEGGISQTFNDVGSYRVEFTATNAGGTSSPAVSEVTIVTANQFAFLLPVVAHLNGNGGSKWRTDVQLFNTDPLNGPMTLTFEFRGGATSFTKTLALDSSTKVYEDFLSVLVSPFTLDDAGPVIVRGTSQYPPQMWTRTYTVDSASIGTYGQFIPAVPIDTSQQSADQPGAYIIPGLEISSQFRTNLGVVNPSNKPVTATVTATDDTTFGALIGSFSVDLGEYSLMQIGNLTTRIPGLANGRPFSIKIVATNSAPLVVYGSMIDQVSQDPVYVSGVRDADRASPDMKMQIVPGAGHLEQSNGTWRSDVVIFNDDAASVKFTVSYWDGTGTKVAEARDQMLAAGAFVSVEDILRWPLLDRQPPDSFGIVKVETTSVGVTKYPIVFQRTYKDRGKLGTFGQGIPAISGNRPNVKLNAPAYIPGVRSDTSFYTNLGIVGLGPTSSRVRVSLLDELHGQVVGTWEKTVNGTPDPILPFASVIQPNIVRVLSSTDTKGTLRIEVLEGSPVWAYASILASADPTCGCTLPEHTGDPEYIPAIPMK